MLYYTYLFLLQVKPKVKSATYKLTSTVILWLQTTRAASGIMNLCGQLTRQVNYFLTNMFLNLYSLFFLLHHKVITYCYGFLVSLEENKINKLKMK